MSSLQKHSSASSKTRKEHKPSRHVIQEQKGAEAKLARQNCCRRRTAQRTSQGGQGKQQQLPPRRKQGLSQGRSLLQPDKEAQGATEKSIQGSFQKGATMRKSGLTRPTPPTVTAERTCVCHIPQPLLQMLFLHPGARLRAAPEATPAAVQ